MKNKKFIIIAIILLIITVSIPVAKIAVENLYERGIWLHGKTVASTQFKHGQNLVWEYNPANVDSKGKYSNLGVVYEASNISRGGSVISTVDTASAVNTSSDRYLGCTVGGANNANNFRANIKNGYLPLSTDITYNGIYSEYYFNTGDVDRSSNEMFYPSYSMAVSKNPITGENEYYMAVGLNSNIKESDFNRKKLNLVVVLDISGSMSSSFNEYYYDGKNSSNEDDDRKTKMRIAEECINNLIDQLHSDDRIGIVLFDDEAYLGCKIVEIGDTNTEDLKSHILEVGANGGTNFSSGYKMATELFGDIESSTPGITMYDTSYENRIIVITDAMPNLGDTSIGGLAKEIEKNSKNKIYTTFVGVGVDFNTKYTEGVSDVRGFNYHSVHNSKEFKKILADEFDYMVTPLVYDLDLSFKSSGYEIENVYGSDSVNKSTGNIMHINTLFPASSNDDGEVKGGIVVLKLKKTSNSTDSGKIELIVSYKDVYDKSHKNSQAVSFKGGNDEYYDNEGIRKAIVLARYVGAMKNWIIYENSKDVSFDAEEVKNVTEYAYDDDYVKRALGINERASVKLTVSDGYKQVFKKMKSYMESENSILKDKELEKELEILDLLA